MSDVFISYRRKNGEAWAALIKGLLTARGLRCYLDKHKKRTKDFKDALFRNIEQANNFVIILSEGIFDIEVSDDIDWVREEIAYAKKLNKNIVGVITNGYKHSEIDWNKEVNKEIKFLKTLELLKYDDTNVNLRDASIDSIVSYLIDEKGNAWKNSLKDNNNWYENGLTEEDRLWMYTQNQACRKLDTYALTQLLKNDALKDKDHYNYFNMCAYDIPTLKERVFNEKNGLEMSDKISVYGFCHEYDINEANEAFGDKHFSKFNNEKELEKDIKELLKQNNIKYFDIIECTLVLKDCEHPETVLRILTKFLNPKGAAIYIRDLDDDFVSAYPDEKGMINKLVELLTLDPGAGNRHFGKMIYTYLKRSGADEVHMIDGDVTTANCKAKMQRIICESYFSYLIPEFRVLVEQEPENEDYVDALNWLNNNYYDVISMFESPEFYFRAGYISGYGIYVDEEYE